MKISLEYVGFIVDVAHSIIETKVMLSAGHYTAMTLDLILPSGDAVEFLRELRKDSATKNLPVIVVSAKAEEVHKQLRDEDMGITEWLKKPVDQAKLIHAIFKIIEHPMLEKNSNG